MSALDLSRVNILLIDDSRSVRMVITTLLRGLGITRIHQSRDMEEAMIMARLCRPDLALVDYDLGLMSGIDLIRRFRDVLLSPNPALAMVLLAPPGLPHIVRGAVEAGASSVLPKPVNPGTLRQRIAEVWQAAGQQDVAQYRNTA